MVCEGMILWWGFKGFHLTQMNSMVPGTHLGVLVCPKTSSSNYPTPVPGFPSTPRSFLEAGLAEAAFVEAGLVEPVFPGALARLQIGNS